LVGALNLLRRLATEHLKAQRRLKLPVFQYEVAVSFPNREKRQTVEWDAQPVAVEWSEFPTQDAPVARLKLDSDAVADLFVDVGEEMPFRRMSPSSPYGVVAYFVPLPPIAALRSEATATAHIVRSGRFAWVHQPDSYGLIDDVRDRLEKGAAAEQTAWESRLRRERELFEAERERVIATARSIQGPTSRALQSSAPLPVLKSEMTPGWAKLRNPLRNFFGYRYASRGAWVLLELTDGRGAARRLVDEDRGYWLDGIEEALMARYGLDLIVFSSLADAQISMANERTVSTCITSSLSEIREMLVDG
jgi:hypothetical protein